MRGHFSGVIDDLRAMPTIVFPDEHDGHVEAGSWPKTSVTKIGFCYDYKKDYVGRGKNRCRNRHLMGVRNHIPCSKCVAGWLYDLEHMEVQSRLDSDRDLAFWDTVESEIDGHVIEDTRRVR